MRKILAVIALSIGFSFVVKAQEVNIDSLCNLNISIAREYVKAGNYKEAYEPWKSVVKHRPALRFYLYTDGYKILKHFLGEIQDKNSADYKKYFEELMALHDKRIEVTPEFLERGTRVPSVEQALSDKAVDYLMYCTDPDIDVAYNWLQESTSATKAESSNQALYFLLHTSANKIKKDESHKAKFLEDFMTAMSYVDEVYEKFKEDPAKAEACDRVKESFLGILVSSGTANCETLQEVYGKTVEENKDNKEFLSKAISILSALKCRESEAYMQASYYLYKIEPTSDAAMGCASQAYKKGDVDAAINFMNEAINLESSSKGKSEKAYYAAAMLAGQKKYSSAKSYCYKALEHNPSNGNAYILLANIYASSPSWSDEATLNKCTYYLVIDKLQKARSVDSSVSEEATRLIGKYSSYLPQTKDLFMLGYKKGDSITIGGWIGESTTIR